MKKTFAVLNLLVGLLFIATSCEKDAIEINTKALMPLNENNSWTYKQTWKSNSSEYIDTVKSAIGKKMNVSGQEGYIYNIGQRPHNAKFLSNTDINGNLILVGGVSDVDTLLVSSILYKYDAEKGDVWNADNVVLNEDGSFEKNTIEITCITNDTLITTPKGAFNCIVFKQSPNSGEDVFKYYFSRNVGIVKNEHFELNKLLSFEELIDFKLIE